MLERSENDSWMARDEYVLKYNLYGDVYELFDDLQLLYPCHAVSMMGRLVLLDP